MSKPEFQGALTRDRSLITGRGSRGGGVTKWKGRRASEVLPLHKEAEKVLVMLKGDTKCFEVVLPRELEVLAILKGEAQKVSTL